MQFLADVFQEPIIRSAQHDSSAAGAAYLAGLAVGFWKDLAELRSLQLEGTVFKPRADRAAYCQSLFNEWCRVVKRFGQWYSPKATL